jgi:hypothetical protein
MANEITRMGKWFIGAELVLVVVGMCVVAAISPDPNVTPESAAGVLALVAAGAVAIERVLEGIWTLVGLKNDWWPMNRMKQAVDTFTGGLNEQLTDVFTDAESFVRRLGEAEKWADDTLNDALEDVDRLRTTTLDNLQTLAQNAPANQRLQFAAASADRALNFLESKYPDLQRATFITGQSLDIAAEFVATFKDNPGRRLISVLKTGW